MVNCFPLILQFSSMPGHPRTTSLPKLLRLVNRLEDGHSAVGRADDDPWVIRRGDRSCGCFQATGEEGVEGLRTQHHPVILDY